MYSYRISQTVFELKEMAEIALNNNLWIKDWTLQGRLLDIVNGAVDPTAKLAVAYYNDVPIGVSLERKSLNGRFVAVFVRVDHRLKGVGRELVSLVKSDSPKYGEGIDGSLMFWQKTLGKKNPSIMDSLFLTLKMMVTK